MSQATLAMFWIAEYSDGMALPQFDPSTGAENLFKEIDFTKLCRFGWYPFTENLYALVPFSICLPLSFITVAVAPGDKLIAHRSVSMDFKPATNKITGHIADEYVVGIEGKYRITINALKNQMRCE
jgi:hypothetical protein